MARGRVTILLVAALVAVGVLLAVLALQHDSTSSPSGAGAVRRHTPVPSAPRTPSSSPATGTASAVAPRSPSYVAVGHAGVVLRASRGDCRGSVAPVVAVSTDLGGSFRTHRVAGLAEVLRADVVADGSLSLIGRTSTCQVARWTSIDDGTSWSRTAGARGWWYQPSPDAPAVVAPDGRRVRPCRAAGLSAVDAGVARLLCRDGTILGTFDGGASWATLGRLDGAVGIAFTNPGDGVALVAQDGCPAAVMVTSDGAATWSRRACLDGDRPVAIGAEGDAVVAQVGDALDASTDGGRSWSGGTG